MNSRSISDRVFSWCLGFFLAAALLYAGVQFVRAIVWWLLAGGLLLGGIALTLTFIRWRRERW